MSDEAVQRRIDKLEKKLTDTFVAEARTSSKDKLEEKIVTLSKEIEAIEDAREADTKLTVAKEMVKDLAGAYGDARKEKKAKLTYILLTLKQKEG